MVKNNNKFSKLYSIQFHLDSRKNDVHGREDDDKESACNEKKAKNLFTNEWNE